MDKNLKLISENFRNEFQIFVNLYGTQEKLYSKLFLIATGLIAIQENSLYIGNSKIFPLFPFFPEIPLC